MTEPQAAPAAAIDEARIEAIYASPARLAWFHLAALVAAAVFVIVIVAVAIALGWIILAAGNAAPAPNQSWPALSAMGLLAIPVIALILAFLVSRGSDERTFPEQQAVNRRVSLLLLITMVGILAVVGEVIAASITFSAYGSLAGAAIGGVGGVAAAVYAQRSGPHAVLAAIHARPASRQTEPVLFDVAGEIAIAADVPPPALYVIQDGSLNALSVGTRSGNSAVAVTSGLLAKLDREELQGVMGHEIGHIRNGDSQYGVYLAVIVGLVALVTDGFLQVIVRAWQSGAFFRGASGKNALGGLIAGVVLGLFLLAVAAILQVFAPLASLLVQASASRQREFLADATSVELTRNPSGLARALVDVGADQDTLDEANRGSQHLWFANPVKIADDGRWNLLATHPTVAARIARLETVAPEIVAEVNSEEARVTEPPQVDPYADVDDPAAAHRRNAAKYSKLAMQASAVSLAQLLEGTLPPTFLLHGRVVQAVRVSPTSSEATVDVEDRYRVRLLQDSSTYVGDAVVPSAQMSFVVRPLPQAGSSADPPTFELLGASVIRGGEDA